MSEAVTEPEEVPEGYQKIQFGPKSLVIPQDWTVRNFGDVFSRRKESIKPEDSETVPYVGLKNLDSGELHINGYDEDGHERSSSRAFREGDVLFGKLRPNLKKAAIAPFDGVCSSDIIPIYAQTESLQRYLPYLMHSKIVQDRAVSTMEGTNLPRTSWDDIESTLVPLPPEKERNRIAAILSTVDEEIEQNERVIDLSEKLKRGLLQELFTKGINHDKYEEVRIGPKITTIPTSWDVRNLGEISRVKRGASPRPIDDEKYFGGDVAWVRISDISDSHKYLTETSDCLSDEGVEESVRVRPGTVLLSISATVGKPIILRTDACIHDGLVGFKDLSEDIHPEFLYYALLEMRPRLKAQNQRAAGHQTNVNSTVVKQSKIAVPPFEEQEAIADYLGAIDEKIGQEIDRREKLKEMKQGLIQDLLTGKVRVNSEDTSI